MKHLKKKEMTCTKNHFGDFLGIASVIIMFVVILMGIAVMVGSENPVYVTNEPRVAE